MLANPPVLDLARRCRDFFARHGVREAAPPLLEPLATFEGVAGLDGEALFRLVDGGQVYVLRPDATLPLARRVAAAGVPPRAEALGYVLPVVRRRESGAVEIWQAGVERVGPEGDADDAGVLRLGLALLAALESGRPLVTLGHQGLLAGVLAELGLDAAAAATVRVALARRAYATVHATLAGPAAARAGGALLRALLDPALPPARAEALLRQAADAFPALAPAVAQLLSAARDLAAVAVVTLEPGLCRRPDYYDGLVFEVAVDGGAQPVLAGGRCDSVLRRFGARGSWCGFALDLEGLASIAHAARPTLAALH